MTSLLIHVTPAVVTYCLRHLIDNPAFGVCLLRDCVSLALTARPVMNETETPQSILGATLVLYVAWQVLYYVKVGLMDAEKIKDKGYTTSFSYLQESKGFIGNLIRSVPPRFGMAMFMFIQLIYTIATLLPTVLCANSATFHFGWIVCLVTWSAWNGAAFYIEVFSARYQSQLDALEAKLAEGNAQ